MVKRREDSLTQRVIEEISSRDLSSSEGTGEKKRGDIMEYGESTKVGEERRRKF